MSTPSRHNGIIVSTSESSKSDKAESLESSVGAELRAARPASHSGVKETRGSSPSVPAPATSTDVNVGGSVGGAKSDLTDRQLSSGAFESSRIKHVPMFKKICQL
ncbi:hypothetical protein C8J57DRAFT_1221974 [Mycena rebaudengoi]|nr:hypothetical protein C8J57DRAFT_1221974 [Mycena rebaudengoi]